MFEVIVGNIGVVWCGFARSEADEAYHYYVTMSLNGGGRGGHEPVTLMGPGGPVKEHEPR